MCAALSPTPPDSSTNSSISNSGKINSKIFFVFVSQKEKSSLIITDHQISDDKNGAAIESNNQYQQPSFLHSFEAELDRVDEYFQTKAPDVRQAILNSLQQMYNQNEWHDNPLTTICRDLEIHVDESLFLFCLAGQLTSFLILFRYQHLNN